MRVAVAVLAVLVASTTLLRGGSALARPGATGISDWPEFGYDPARQNVGPASPGITVATFRDALGTTRRFALPLLEYFDGRGLTRRQGDARVVVGSAG